MLLLVSVVFREPVRSFFGWTDRGEEVRQHDDGALRVIGVVEYEGARYLLWSNGSITPDMADYQKCENP